MDLVLIRHGRSIADDEGVVEGGGYLRFRNGDTAISRLTINGPQDVLTHFLNDESHLRGAKPKL